MTKPSFLEQLAEKNAASDAQTNSDIASILAGKSFERRQSTPDSAGKTGVGKVKKTRAKRKK